MPHQNALASQSKAFLRAHFRAARRQLAPSEQAELSSRIVAHILRWLDDLDTRPQAVALYLASPLEASLDALIEPLRARGVRVAAPRGDGFALVDAASTCVTLQAQSWRQADGETVGVPELDVILVPGLAFGRDGSRLGQGAGWFDRALSGSRAILAGVAFGWQIVDALPAEEHDVPMQWIVTEDGVRAAKR